MQNSINILYIILQKRKSWKCWMLFDVWFHFELGLVTQIMAMYAVLDFVVMLPHA